MGRVHAVDGLQRDVVMERGGPGQPLRAATKRSRRGPYVVPEAVDDEDH